MVKSLSNLVPLQLPQRIYFSPKVNNAWFCGKECAVVRGIKKRGRGVPMPPFHLRAELRKTNSPRAAISQFDPKENFTTYSYN
mgnify:FL=1